MSVLHSFFVFTMFVFRLSDLQIAVIYACSVSVFGVSAESMQCSYDSKGNSVPTILMLMQDRLYSQGGLKVL
jgi:hypothetical protein